jgi:hypothetical protein
MPTAITAGIRRMQAASGVPRRVQPKVKSQAYRGNADVQTKQSRPGSGTVLPKAITD